MFTLVIALEQL